MTPGAVAIVALVSASEREAVEAAGRHVARALTEAAGAPWQTDIGSHESPGAVLLTSFGPEVALDEKWPETEARLRALYHQRSESGDPVFICTVLRHVREVDPAERLRRLVRIRRLNLLAAEISRETGAFV